MVTRSKPMISVFNDFCDPHVLDQLKKNIGPEIELDFSSGLSPRFSNEKPQILKIYRTNLKLFYPENYDSAVLENIINGLLEVGFVEKERLFDDRIIFEYHGMNHLNKSRKMIRIVNAKNGRLISRIYCSDDNILKTIKESLQNRNRYLLDMRVKGIETTNEIVWFSDIRFYIEPEFPFFVESELKEMKITDPQLPLCDDCCMNSAPLYFDWCNKHQCEKCYQTMSKDLD